MIDGVILQKGAFNPVHRMHVRIAEDAIKAFPGYMHLMCLAQHTWDKGEISTEELQKRCDAIRSVGYRPVIENDGRFIDSIERVREAFGADIHIVFACGEDTLQRFFRDWDAHYNYETNPDHWKKHIDYCRIFRGVTWYVSRRDTECRKYNNLVTPYMREYNNVEWSDLPLDEISSTKIRNGEVK